MLNVETAMRWYARHWISVGWQEDEELYAVTGLLHDFDYELHPAEHPAWGVAYLRDNTDLPGAPGSGREGCGAEQPEEKVQKQGLCSGCEP